MITSIAIKNYGCILDSTLDLTYGERLAPRGYRTSSLLPFIELGKARVVPSLALIGPNASGKTTIIRALRTIFAFIRGRRVTYHPYRLKEPMLPISTIEVSWIDQNNLYSYLLGIGSDQIVSESLKVDNEIIFQSQSGKLSCNIKNISNQDYEKLLKTYDLQCVTAETKYQIKSALNVLAEDFPGLNSHINKAFTYWTTKLHFYGLDHNQPSNFLAEGIDKLSKTFPDISPSNQEAMAWDLLSKYMRKLDFNIHKVLSERKKINPEDLPFPEEFKKFLGDSELFSDNVKTYHLTENGNLTPFQINWESNGTRHLMKILCYLLTAVRTGGVAVVDEIEESLHTLLVKELIKLFNDRELNKTKAQIIFTTHNTDLLSDSGLRPSQIAIVSQRGFNGSFIRRLVDIEGVKPSDDFRKNYLNGYYDAIPSAYL